MATDNDISRNLKLGMVGGGKDAFIGAVHRKAAALDGGIDFVAGALSSTPEKAKASGRALGLAEERNYGSWEEMLGRESALPAGERLNLISIVTPNHLHYPVAKAFAEAGFNIVCDKPLVHNSEQARELVRISKEKDIVFAVSYNYTGYPMVKQARHMIREGQLGELRKVIVEYNQGWLATRLEQDGSKQADWRTDPARAGIAGAMGDIGSHAENLVSTITGLELAQLCADLSTFAPGRKLDDDGNLLLRFTSGAKGVMIASQIATGEENNLRIRVYGTKASLSWRQEEPNYLDFKPLAGPAQVLKRGNDYLCEAAKRATRLPPGHPEAFIEAFANIYQNVAATIRAKREGREATVERDFPTVVDGAKGVYFIEKTIQSSSSEQKWIDATWESRA